MTSTSFPLLYGITDTKLSGCASHFEVARRLMENGVKLIQIRYKGASDKAFYEEVVESVQLASTFHARIIVNDRVDIALASGAHGVHLGEGDLPSEKARAILGPQSMIGVSTHSFSKALEASHQDVDYIAIGPIFETKTKGVRNPPLGPQTISEIRKQTRKPIVAIGGITLEKLPEVIGSGADAVAVISDLLGQNDIDPRVQQYLRFLESL